jgi:hypothetical protein
MTLPEGRLMLLGLLSTWLAGPSAHYPILIDSIVINH